MPIEKQEEFEIVPMSPIRRLERRLDQLESTSGVDTRSFLKEIVDIIKMNQMLVDELAKANDSLRIEISKLPSKLEELINHLTELLSYIKASAAEEAAPATAFKPLVDKFDKLIEANKRIVEGNQSILSALEEIGQKLKRRPLPPRAHMKPVKMMPPPKPVVR